VLLQEKGFQIEVYDRDEPIQRKLLEQKIVHADGLICLLSDNIDKSLINRAGNLKIIANYAAGFNNIDIAYAASRGIVVSNTPDILTAATADLAWSLLLSVSKRIVESDRFTRAGEFRGWGPMLFLGGDVTRKTLGIIGAGRIGQAVAQRAAGFEMQIVYHDTRPLPEFEKKTGARYCSIQQLFSESDFISIHCPLNNSTHHLINSANIYQIKKGAYLINTARGQVVEEKALVDALKSGHLAGAGLDVYEFEPQISPEIKSLEQVILLPHIGSATFETRSEMARIAARNVISVIESGKALTPINT